MDRSTVPIGLLHPSAQLSPHSRTLPLYAIAVPYTLRRLVHDPLDSTIRTPCDRWG